MWRRVAAAGHAFGAEAAVSASAPSSWHAREAIAFELGPASSLSGLWFNREPFPVSRDESRGLRLLTMCGALLCLVGAASAQMGGT
jgi:hypothetical protein